MVKHLQEDPHFSRHPKAIVRLSRFVLSPQVDACYRSSIPTYDQFWGAWLMICCSIQPHLLYRAMVIVVALFCFQSLLLNSAADPSGNKCPQPSGREDSSCVCQADDGIIDLTPLSNTDNSPKYDSYNIRHYV